MAQILYQLTSKKKKQLRDYFNQQLNTDFKSIKSFSKYYNIDDNNETYEVMRDTYNDYINDNNIVLPISPPIDEIEEKKELVISPMEPEISHHKKFFQSIAQKKSMKTPLKMDGEGIHFKDVQNEVHKWVDNQWDRETNSSFEVKLKSALYDGNMVKTFKFRNLCHFDNFMKRALEEGFDDQYKTELAPSDIQYIPKDENGISNINYFDNTQRDFFSIVSIESVSWISGGCNKHGDSIKSIKSTFYKHKLFIPKSRRNNCFIECLRKICPDIKLTTHNFRKMFDLKPNTEITINQAYKILTHFELLDSIQIIDWNDMDDDFDENMNYILLKDNHYHVLTENIRVLKKDRKTKRGLMTVDFEARKTENYTLIKATGEKRNKIKDTICRVYYREYKSNEMKTQCFITDSKKTSARKFLDFLNEESLVNRSYNIIGHNGGNFDWYLVMNIMSENETFDSNTHFRGKTIISLNYKGNLFKDSCCFLTDKLSNLSNTFKVEVGKLTELELYGEKITNEELCFYKPELTFNDFMELEYNEPEFWDLYIKYCLYDCISLFQVWEKFKESTENAIKEIGKELSGKDKFGNWKSNGAWLLKHCPLMASSTIGSHAKKILVNCNQRYNWDTKKIEDKYYKKQMTQFYLDENDAFDMTKYKFICRFKRGGISHCAKKGKHWGGIFAIDITSQYPASLFYGRMPCGKSFEVECFDDKYHGFYLIKNMKFNNDSYKFKPISKCLKGQSLDWEAEWGENDELYIDSYMLKYLKEKWGLVSFDVIKGYVSFDDMPMANLFGPFIKTFFDLKKQQDAYKAEKNPLYNEALRSTLKLYMNALSGKLVENPANHFSLKFLKGDCSSSLKLNNVNVEKVDSKEINEWVIAGVMVYSYSKILLFEYIDCLPNKANDVIHVETDGIYVSQNCREEFENNMINYKGNYPVKFGNDLGNVKVEKNTQKGQVAYYLGKKFYCITQNSDFHSKNQYPELTQYEYDLLRADKDKNIYKIKGIPLKSHHDDGRIKYLMGVEDYERIFQGENLTKSFPVLRKEPFSESENCCINGLIMTRTIKSDKEVYNEYF